jgi:hypothetical protein
MGWSKDDAILELEALIKEAENVALHGKTSSEFMRWYMRSANFLEEVFGGASKLVLMFMSLPFKTTGRFVIQSMDIQGELDRRDRAAFRNCIRQSVGIFQAGLDELSRKSLSEVYEGKNTPSVVSHN